MQMKSKHTHAKIKNKKNNCYFKCYKLEDYYQNYSEKNK